MELVKNLKTLLEIHLYSEEDQIAFVYQVVPFI